MFEMRLAGHEPDFGYITCTKRLPFVMFCIKFGFIEFDNVYQVNKKLYDVRIPFRYMAMFRYEPKPVVMTDTSLAVVGEDFKMFHGGGRLLV
jgi:hypothetical protein